MENNEKLEKLQQINSVINDLSYTSVDVTESARFEIISLLSEYASTLK